jgi:hypothetical protein
MVLGHMVDLISIVDVSGRVRVYFARCTMLPWRAHFGNEESVAIVGWYWRGLSSTLVRWRPADTVARRMSTLTGKQALGWRISEGVVKMVFELPVLRKNNAEEDGCSFVQNGEVEAENTEASKGNTRNRYC